jgi:hypothetical protein
MMYAGATVTNLTSTSNCVIAALTTINESLNINWLAPSIGTLGTPPTPTPTITVSGLSTICNSTPVILISSSGSDNTWSNGDITQNISTYVAGTYTVTVTQHGCAAISNPVIVDELLSTLTANNLTCLNSNNGSIITNTHGGNLPYTYAWHQGCYRWNTPTTQNIYNLQPCLFTVTITDNNGCSVSNSATISNPPLLLTTIQNNGSTATANTQGGTAPYTYLWNRSSNCGKYNQETTQTINILSNCSYYVTVTDACGEQAYSSLLSGGQKNVSMNASNFDSNEIKIFPNPSNGTFEISNVSNTSITIFDIFHKEISKVEKVETSSMSFDLSSFANGIYYIEIVSCNIPYIKKLIISK